MTARPSDHVAVIEKELRALVTGCKPKDLIDLADRLAALSAPPEPEAVRWTEVGVVYMTDGPAFPPMRAVEWTAETPLEGRTKIYVRAALAPTEKQSNER